MIEYSVQTINCLGDDVETKFLLYREARKYFDRMIEDKEMKFVTIYDVHNRELVRWSIDD
jgi:hypothetical protein